MQDLTTKATKILINFQNFTKLLAILSFSTIILELLFRVTAIIYPQ